jgi:zinc transporter, ZIP family
MSYGTTLLLGAIAGLAMFLGLLVARLPKRAMRLQRFLNALATGILIFLLWDVLSKANEPIVRALVSAHAGEVEPLAVMLGVFIGGLATGLLSLIYFNRALADRFRRADAGPAKGPGAATATQPQGLRQVARLG